MNKQHLNLNRLQPGVQIYGKSLFGEQMLVGQIYVERILIAPSPRPMTERSKCKNI